MYKITYANRCVIEKRREEGWSYRKIADEIGLSKTAIAHEIKSKSGKDKVYRADRAHFASEQIRYRNKTQQRKTNNKELLLLIGKLLKKGKSPYDISRRLKKKYSKSKMLCSHETIYKMVFSYKNIASHPCATWYTCLRQKNKKRHVRGHTSAYRQKRRYLPSIHKVNAEVLKRFSVWEVDTMYLRGGFIAVAVERVSRKIMAMPIANLKADTMTKALQFLFSRVAKIDAIIIDRGTENAGFRDIQRMLNTRVFACDPGAPWQKGLVENSIHLLRYTFPRKTRYEDISKNDVYKAVASLNSMHRVVLNGGSSREVYSQNLLKVS